MNHGRSMFVIQVTRFKKNMSDHLRRSRLLWNEYGRFCVSLHMRAIVWLVVAAVSLGMSIAAESPKLPSTPAGKVLDGYLDALNSGDKEKLESFVTTHRPDRPNAVDIMLDLRWNTGGLDLYSVESSDALDIQGRLLDREGGMYNGKLVIVTDGN